MKEIYSQYKTELIVETQSVKPEGASIIEFINQGTDTVTLLGTIILNTDQRSYAFVNRENVEIKHEFLVSFAGTGTKSVAVIKTIYEKQ